jgi:twitching motility two-component system response regulator PilG
VSSAKSETIEESSTSESLSHEESVEIEKPTISDSAAYGVALKSENKYASEQQKEISLESDQVEEKNEVQMEAVLENPEVESSKATTEPVEISDVGVLSEETKESTVVSPLPEEFKETIDVTPAFEKTQGPLILVVDDSPTVRKLITTKLERSGYRVIQAVDGLDALEKINSTVPDLVLLDITMPNLDGYEVCKRIRSNESTKNIPVVMISGKDGFFDKVRGRMVGSSGYITKPFGPETLMKTVESYIKNTQRTN